MCRISQKVFSLKINNLLHNQFTQFFLLQESGKCKSTVRRKMSSSISLPSFRLPSKAKFWKKRRSEDLGDSDPSYRAIYLGNVLTGWAKGKSSNQRICSIKISREI